MGCLQRNQYAAPYWKRRLLGCPGRGRQCTRFATNSTARLVEFHWDSGPTARDADRGALLILSCCISISKADFGPPFFCARKSCPQNAWRRLTNGHRAITV